MVKWKIKSMSLIIGLIAGVGAPVGSLLIRGFFFNALSMASLQEEIIENKFFYIYMTVTTPAVFALLSYCYGAIIAKSFHRKDYLEKIMPTLLETSKTDDLTRVCNRRHIIAELNRELERAVRYHRSLSGMMIDIDNFKNINDTYGHLVGDDIIKEVASLIKENIRAVDSLGRLGGDEFLVVLPESSIVAAQDVAQRIVRRIQNHKFRVNNRFIDLTVSIGIDTLREQKYCDKASFIDRMDQAMYQAKHLGKHRVCIFKEYAHN